jgi:murein L,D-transpeptidase YafK
MTRKLKIFIVLIMVLLPFAFVLKDYSHIIGNIWKGKIPQEVRTRITESLEEQLASHGFEMGDPVFMRIFKEEAELEVWMKSDDVYRLFKTYPICNYSGNLGPKLREGDRQSPEGFYYVGLSALNPNSSYHLSFNLGFPNAYDRSQERTGSYLMVHGNCVSIGCYAMTDIGIGEIYGLAEAALQAGQPIFRVHAFPFRMTDTRMERASSNRWFEFWQNLKEGYDAFENSLLPPNVTVDDGRYVFAPSNS